MDNGECIPAVFPTQGTVLGESDDSSLWNPHLTFRYHRGILLFLHCCNDT